MLTHALVVKIVAKENRAEEVAEFLTGAVTLAEQEAFTPIWFALRADATTFYVVDAFANAEDRQKHLDGDIAAALMANAEALLAEAPGISSVDILASKTP
ncbi:MAG: antibiotic biosynthesis monooxygenase [Acidobacteriota bacterium]